MKDWYWLNENAIGFLKRGYLAEGQTTQERVKIIGDRAEGILGREGFSEKFQGYMAKGWISLASPVWSNFGTTKGLPISCFGSYIDDTMGSILYTQAEVGMMSKVGGGCSGYFGDLRGRGEAISGNGESSGAVHFMQMFETLMDVISQGSVRRGSFSPYLPTSHPDIMEFLEIAAEGNPIQKLTHGVTVSDKWMKEMIDGDEEKRVVWAKVLQSRKDVGYPYVLFVDNANNQKPQVYKDKKKEILASNLCNEIMLPSSKEWSFVCCLSSLNLLHFDEWKDTDLVETMISFLDAVMSDFITKLEEMRDSEDEEQNHMYLFMKRAHAFAKENRALGMGVLGYHSYLQGKNIPFESEEAEKANKKIFKTIQSQADKATEKLAEELGEPEILKGYGRRNTTTMALAPTTSSAFILGQVSQGIEPIWSNCYVKDVAKARVVIKNNQLMEILEELGQNTTQVWASIRDHDGSVQHLEWLHSDIKEVFKTFGELDQYKVLKQASDRQKHIDQGQSLNVKVSPEITAKEMNQLMIYAWENGIKGMYYQHSESAAQSMVRKKKNQA